MTNRELESRLESERLAGEVIRLQKEVNNSRSSYKSMCVERDNYLRYAMRLESFLNSKIKGWKEIFE